MVAQQISALEIARRAKDCVFSGVGLTTTTGIVALAPLP
jgi:hypothetical protein